MTKAAAVVYLILTKRPIRVMRAGDEEWRQRWRELPPGRRKAILNCGKSINGGSRIVPGLAASWLVPGAV